MSMINAALTLARKGKPVFPCKKDKTPYTRHGFKDATTNENQIKKWWVQFPNALIGMPTGKTSGIVVLDIDNKNGHDGDESLCQLELQYGKLPDSIRVLTPSGGRHIYFKQPNVKIKSSASDIGDGLDIRGDGGYIIIPPSKPNGKAYEWEASNPKNIADMPNWLIEQTKAHEVASKNKTLTSAKQQETIDDGTRHTKLTSYAGTLHKKGLSVEEIGPLLFNVNKTRCNPPLPDKDIQDIVRQVSKWEQGENVDHNGFPISLVISAHELAVLDIPPRTFIIDSVLLQQSLAMVYGFRGRGKTWFVLSLAIAIASGKKFLYWDVPHPRRVLFVDGEMPAADIQNRINQLCGIKPPELLDIICSDFFFESEKESLTINNAIHQERLLSLLEKLETNNRKPDVIVFDNLSSMTHGDENSNSDQDVLLSFMRELRHEGYTVVMVHHSGKGGDQRGASRREDFLDLSIKLNEPSAPAINGAKFKVEFAKVRGEMPTPHEFEVELITDEHGQLVWTMQEGCKEPAKWVQALKYIYDYVPKSQKDVAEAMCITPATVGQHLKKARGNGLLDKLIVTKKGEEYLQKVYGTLEKEHVF